MLTTAADTCLDALLAAADRDWSRPAHGLDWSCRQTLDHLALGLLGYAGLLIARPRDRYITLFGSLDPQAPIADCVEGLRIAASLLTTTVRDTPEEVRAWHPWGHADAAGFAAMGVVELLVHTHDIGRSLGLAWTMPGDLGAAALARLFPDAPGGHAPAATLLWCTGRAALPGLARRTSWQWDGRVR
ncbi:maleylpyruvate isomerase N-terminal domain-containing protein [Streptomonospora sp. NEAU-YY374]|nr:maleylpyruvate isomerase N-terminal domain-containing protein [Streptomonospora nanhaiensis]MBV2367068.1 maleylpyruvate isomerase N-terminal domain-containing protein [Streptomonospora nanhaiensis]MBX9387219.1 maleylpyruvate isomerase N-terminal domain-containing protein [Streptomonospora nanhaiensis]